MPRSVVALLLAALTLTACSGSSGSAAGGASTPTPTSSSKPTGQDAVAALEASPAGGWAEGGAGFGDTPPLPAGISAEALEDADRYGRKWLGIGMLDSRTWAGDFDEWLRAAGKRFDLAAALDGPKAANYVTAFPPEWEVLDVRARGMFTAEPTEPGGDVLRLTWRGSVLYAVQSPNGDGAVVPTWREVFWDSGPNDVIPSALSAGLEFDNVVVCESQQTRRLVPVAGALEVDPGFFAAQDKPAPPAQEQAALEAELAACGTPAPVPVESSAEG